MKKHSSLVVLLLVVGPISFPVRSSACPVFGRPSLWLLVERSDLVALARVQRVDVDESPGNPFLHGHSADHETALLTVIDSWKGEFPSEVRVENGGHYAVGEVVLVFLERGEAQARAWRTLLDEARTEALTEWDSESSGDDGSDLDWLEEYEEEVRLFEAWAPGRWLESDVWDASSLEAEDLDALREAIARAGELQASGNAGADARREWLIQVTEARATRRHAVGDLANVESELSDSDLARLAAAFIRTPSVNEDDLALLKLLTRRSDSGIDLAAASLVEAGLLLRPIPAWVVELVDVVLQRYGDSFADRIGRDDRDPRGRLIYTGEGENTLPTIWEVARRELGIPETRPAEAPPALTRRSAAERGLEP